MRGQGSQDTQTSANSPAVSNASLRNARHNNNTYSTSPLQSPSLPSHVCDVARGEPPQCLADCSALKQMCATRHRRRKAHAVGSLVFLTLSSSCSFHTRTHAHTRTRTYTSNAPPYTHPADYSSAVEVRETAPTGRLSLFPARHRHSPSPRFSRGVARLHRHRLASRVFCFHCRASC